MVYNMKVLDQTSIYKKYRGLWVVLKQDRLTVIASGKTAQEAMTKAKRTGYKRPILSAMPRTIPSF